MSVNGTGLRTTPKVGRNPGNALYMGVPTQRFFAKGEEQEATCYENAGLPPDDAPVNDPDAEFESFDKIPKARRPIVTIAAIGASLVVGIAAWKTMSGGVRTEQSGRAFAAAPSTNTASGNPATATSMSGTVGRTPRGPLVVPMSPNGPPTPLTDATPVPGRSVPMRGFVWSPTAKALVPRDAPSLPAADSDLVGRNHGPVAAAAEATGDHTNVLSSEASSDRDRGAPTDRSGRRTTRVAPAEPSINHGGVAPAEIGAASDERPAPTADSTRPVSN